MNTYANIFNKMLASQIQQYLKVITHCDQMGFILEMQRWFNIHKPWIHYIITIKNESICDWCTKSILQDSTAVYEEKTKQNKKPLSKIGTEGIYLNIIKAICGKSRANIRHSGKKLKAIPVKLFLYSWIQAKKEGITEKQQKHLKGEQWEESYPKVTTSLTLPSPELAQDRRFRKRSFEWENNTL